jgi:hypothetical protein
MTWRDRGGRTGSKNWNPPAGRACPVAARKRRQARELMALLNLLAAPSTGVDFEAATHPAGTPTETPG